MLDIFAGKAAPHVEVLVQDDVLACRSRLGHGAHEYVYSDLFSIRGLSEGRDEVYAHFRCTATLSISVAFVFYGADFGKLKASFVQANQTGKVPIPADALHYRIALRIQGEGSARIYSLDIGTAETVDSIVARRNRFDLDSLGLVNDDIRGGIDPSSPILLVETIFCDTETNPDRIAKYLSYFIALIACVSRQTYRNFVWLVHISSDKGAAIDTIRKSIERAGLGRSVYLNVFDHPAGGYGNDSDAHVDRRRRPNSTYPGRREFLFDSAIRGAGLYDDADLRDCLLVRLAIDDDDFISPSHFDLIQRVASKHIDRSVERSVLVVGLTRILVSYFLPGGSVEVFDADFSRMMTGCKFAASIGRYPQSPFSITERFDEVEASASTTYLEYSHDVPTFSYNRHGSNLSSQSKRVYFRREHKSVRFDSHIALLNHIMGVS